VSADVVMADDAVNYPGAEDEDGPRGGAESAFVALAEALVLRGHDVEVRARCTAAEIRNGVRWAPIAGALPARCDLYIGSRGHRVIGLVRCARKRLFWLHNPARYLKKPRNLWRLARHRPTLVVTGAYHAATVPPWLPAGGCITIPYGVRDCFRGAEQREPPPPRAIFTSNPLRGLDWLLDLWDERIAPAVPGAELHIYAGPTVYGAVAAKHADAMQAVLARAAALAGRGARRFAPVGCRGLAAALAHARVMLYRGDPGETFCLALAEAQAMGVPAVVTPLGAVAERVKHRVSGYVAQSDDDFVATAITALRDDDLWRCWHLGALAHQRGESWDMVAARFERLAG
jgi:glycosyltransferase involved in cell wall biosynthesis